MKLLICIDDTDNPESRGTGSIAAEMVEIIEKKGWGTCGFISRHQLVLHKDVRYTSHNSSMCFSAEVEDGFLPILTNTFSNYLETESADGSDPGLCIIDVDWHSKSENMQLRRRLIEFGYRAKVEVLTKVEAYALASEVAIHLSEHGGTGDGVIGALAGTALRLHGWDGEVKGGIEHLVKGETFTVGELVNEELISSVCTTDLKPLEPESAVTISWKAKPVMSAGLPVLLVIPKDGASGCTEWMTLQKNEMRSFGDDRAVKRACKHFRIDVPEEVVHEDARSCYNCIYRRWTENSFECTKP